MSEPQFPAVWIVHTPNGPEPCCELHKHKLVNLMRFLGVHAHAETSTQTDLVCNNCVNENLAKATTGEQP